MLLCGGSGGGFGVALLEAALGSLPDTFTQLSVSDFVPKGQGPRAEGRTYSLASVWGAAWGSDAAYGAVLSTPGVWSCRMDCGRSGGARSVIGTSWLKTPGDPLG